MAIINLVDAYQRAFGGAYNPISTIAVVPPTSIIKQIIDGDFRDTPTIQTDRQSLLGTAIHFPCKLGSFELPNEPLIRVTGKNRIVRTPLDGKNGTFKELFSEDDFEVTIRGIAINEGNPDMYPESIIRRIREICRNAETEVTCKLLSYFNIKRLVIEKYDFPPLEGAIWQPYELKCYSDEPYDLELKNA